MDAVSGNAPIPGAPSVVTPHPNALWQSLATLLLEWENNHPNALWQSLATLLLEWENNPGGVIVPLKDTVRRILVAQMGHVTESPSGGDTPNLHHRQQSLQSTAFAAGYRAMLHAYGPHPTADRTGDPGWSPAVRAAFWSNARTSARAVLRQDHPSSSRAENASPPASLCLPPSEEIAPRSHHVETPWMAPPTGQGPESKSKKRGRPSPHFRATSPPDRAYCDAKKRSRTGHLTSFH